MESVSGEAIPGRAAATARGDASCTVTFLPADVSVLARPGDTLLDAALDHAVAICHECGGNCACTTCRVLVQAGMDNLSPPEEAELDRLATAEDPHLEARLSCQALVRGGAIVVVVCEPTETR